METVIFSETVIRSAKVCSPICLDVDTRHVTASLRKLYFVTLTYFLKVKIVLRYLDLLNEDKKLYFVTLIYFLKVKNCTLLPWPTFFEGEKLYFVTLTYFLKVKNCTSLPRPSFWRWKIILRYLDLPFEGEKLYLITET